MTYLVNNVIFLMSLCKNKVFNNLSEDAKFFITDVRLADFSPKYWRELDGYNYIVKLSLDEGFHQYLAEKKRKYPSMSTSELSTLYAANTNKNLLIVASEEDAILFNIATSENLNCIEFDELIPTIIFDNRTIQLYNLIKMAAA